MIEVIVKPIHSQFHSQFIIHNTYLDYIISDNKLKVLKNNRQQIDEDAAMIIYNKTTNC